MNDRTRNPLLAARSQLAAGEIDKQGYCTAINGHHAQLFDYPAFLAGTEVASIQITADGVTVSSARHGISMYVDAVDLHATPYALLGFGSYESDETAFLKSVFGEQDVFLDVGANLGWYSLVLGRQCPQGRIFAFEPIPSTVAMLERNIRLNQLDNVRPIAVGLLDREDELDFLFAEDVSGATSLRMVGQDRGHVAVREVRCKTTTLDAFCTRHALSPDLIKIDVEGAELMVVQGGERTLQTTPIILMELLRKWSRVFDYHPNDVFTHLARHGYQAWAFVGDGSGKLQACAAVTDETLQTNFVFLHPDKHAHVIRQWQVE